MKASYAQPLIELHYLSPLKAVLSSGLKDMNDVSVYWEELDDDDEA